MCICMAWCPSTIGTKLFLLGKWPISGVQHNQKQMQTVLLGTACWPCFSPWTLGTTNWCNGQVLFSSRVPKIISHQCKVLPWETIQNICPWHHNISRSCSASWQMNAWNYFIFCQTIGPSPPVLSVYQAAFFLTGEIRNSTCESIHALLC